MGKVSLGHLREERVERPQIVFIEPVPAVSVALGVLRGADRRCVRPTIPV